MFNPDHQHLLVHARIRRPFQSTDEVNDWLNRVVKAVDMVKLAGPFSVMCEDLGNEGVTGLVVLSTSHASVHCWDDGVAHDGKTYVKIDVYSCKHFTLDQFRPMLDRLDPMWFAWHMIDRNIPRVREHDAGVVHIDGDEHPPADYKLW